jgi:hypothetical protein
MIGKAVGGGGSGSGTDLTGLGTDNRVARWNGADTVQDSNVSIDDTGNLSLSVAGSPELLNEASSVTNPTLLPHKTYNTYGIGGLGGTSVDVIIGGTSKLKVTTSAVESAEGFQTTLADGPHFVNVQSTATSPTMRPNRGATTTGIGGTAGNVTVVAGGAEVATFATGGAITVASTVDGRDLATDGTKLDGIEAGADVTDATNVAAAGAAMAASVIPDGSLVLGDGGVRGVKGSANWTEDANGYLVPGSNTLQIGLSTDLNSSVRGFSGNLFDMYAGNVAVLRIRNTYGGWYKDNRPISDAAASLGQFNVRWKGVFAGGCALEYVESAAASYTVDLEDHHILMTAATAAIVLPAIATVGRGFRLYVEFSGATSRTMTPNGAETVDVASPTQNVLYLVVADGSTNWVMRAIA